MKRPTERKKISSNGVTNRVLIFKICNSSCSSTLKKKKQVSIHNQKIGGRPKYTFLQRRHTGGQRTMKRHWTSLRIREIQIKSTMRYQLIPVRMAIIKKFTNIKCWRRYEEKRSLEFCWWQGILVQPLWKRVSVYFSHSVLSDSMKVLKRLKIRLTIWHSNLTLGHISRENHIWKDTWSPMSVAVLFTIVRKWKQINVPNGGIKNMWLLFTMEYYRLLKRTK